MTEIVRVFVSSGPTTSVIDLPCEALIHVEISAPRIGRILLRKSLSVEEFVAHGYEAGKAGPSEIRRAELEEFSRSLVKSSSLQRTLAYLDEVGKAGASEIAQKTGVSRQTISALLKGEQFVKLGREGHEVLYAIKEDEEGLPF